MARPRRSRTRPRTDEAPEVLTALHRLESLRAVPRLWARDASLWSDDEEVRAAIRTRLGWLDLDRMRPHLSRLLAFGQAVSAEEVRDVVLLGMGGSSLAAEVFATAFPRASGAPRLTVLDTTDPAAIRTVRDGIAIDRTLFIVSSKSGTTAETLALYRYFWSEVEATGAAAGRHFVAITDPGTPLERLATDRGFRETFLNPPDIGGRFSALSFFGLVPAALLAIDPTRLLDAAEAMAQACRDEGPLVEHPALGLAARLGGLGRAGRDKVTLVLSSSIRTFGDWLEQLIMESTGKQGVGLVVVQDEPDASPESYGPDRVFVGITHGSDPALERTLDRREAEGHPTLRFQVTDPVALAGEFLRWEIATAGVAILLGVNPFDEPNVASAKEATHAALATFQDMAHLPEWPTNDVDDLIRMLAETRPPDWIALLAYLTPRADTLAALQRLRRLVLERTRCATTLGFGPRYLHSTGQLMKGGPPTAAMLLFTGKDRDDLPIPGQVYGFSTLKRAQALGDLGALRTAHRRIVWIDLEGDDGEALERLAATVDRRLAPATGETGG